MITRSTKVNINRVDQDYNLTSVEELKDWCYANVGNIGSWMYHRNNDYGRATGWTFYFDKSEDAIAFKLKFGL